MRVSAPVALICLLAVPASAEGPLAHATIALATSGSSWSPGTGLSVGISNRLNLPATARVTRFEFELLPYSCNYPPCSFVFDLPWEPQSPINHATVDIGGNCPLAIEPGFITTVFPSDRAFEYLMGLTSQRERVQSLFAGGGFVAPANVLLDFHGAFDLRAIGEDSTVDVRTDTWSKVRSMYR